VSGVQTSYRFQVNLRYCVDAVLDVAFTRMEMFICLVDSELVYNETHLISRIGR